MHDGQRQSLKILIASPSRLALSERLAEMRRQASALLVREAARAALSNPPKSFETLEAALVDMATRIRTPAREWRPHSELAQGAGQTTLASFF